MLQFLDLPDELLQQIFSCISPRQVLKYRQLCRRLNQCLLDPHFAITNLRLHFDRRTSLTNEQPSEQDILWFQWPQVYQTVYAKHYISDLIELQWHLESINAPLPKGLDQLFQLRNLVLAQCELIGGIPSEVRQLTNLHTLVLANNMLDGPIPSWIGDLVNLKHLDLRNNIFTGRIPHFDQMLNLIHLDLGRNNLVGPIPLFPACL
ncbi:hypothetical protein HDU99_007374, partial [Rhizoclosmatium hyalinum]